jgi:hypothetical protein
MNATAQSDARSEAPSSGGLRGLVEWSWQHLAPELKDGRTEPRFVFPYLHPSAFAFYWELHFERARLLRTDFLQRIPLSGGEAEADAPVEDPIIAPLRAWYAGGDTARSCHDTAWLELDGPLDATGEPRRQGVSVCLDPQFGATDRDSGVVPIAAGAVGAFERLLEVCGADRKRSALLGPISDAAMKLGGSVRHVSVMRGRAGAPCKMYATLPKAAFREFLTSIPWPGDVGAALALAELACAESERIHCDLEFSETVSGRIGFELFSDPPPELDPFRRRTTFTAFDVGLLSRPQAEALETWVGSSRKVLENQRWPTPMQRWLDAKFVHHPGGRRELKLYLGFCSHRGIL